MCRSKTFGIVGLGKLKVRGKKVYWQEEKAVAEKENSRLTKLRCRFTS